MCLNRLPQNSQKYGISPVWLRTCLTRSLLLWNALLQYWHVRGICRAADTNKVVNRPF